eukprot:TRINITY_DN3952_c0_g2_i3.p1 TRINITY_DN3952_c0_g2~~TRINITY_DN3952_c0_g2_i3.p1  ORF type:complete len:353 (-),score=16.39 TRINITY_DN3952_c0_g2_i3:58-1116(-)
MSQEDFKFVLESLGKDLLRYIININVLDAQRLMSLRATNRFFRREISCQSVFNRLVEDCRCTDPDDFEIMMSLNQGSYGSTFEATHRSTGLHVVLKNLESVELHRQLWLEEEAGFPLIRCIAKSFVLGTEPTKWIAEEFCKFGSCCDIVDSRGSFSEMECRSICRDVVLGMEWLRGREIEFQTLAEPKIFIGHSGRARLKISYNVASDRNRAAISLAHYLSPEIIVSARLNEESANVWSLGVTLIGLAEGEIPHGKEHPMRLKLEITFNACANLSRQVLFLISQQPAPTFSDPTKFSAEMNDFLGKCLAKDPKDRSTFKELLGHPFLDVGADARRQLAFALDDYLEKKRRFL